MANVVDYLPFAQAGGANVITQGVYQALAVRLSGFVPGLADASQANKVWRQSAFMSAALANFLANTLGQDVLDDGDLNALIAQITAAISLTPKAARIIAASANFVLATTDYAVGLNRTVAPAATQATLPAAVVGQEF